FHVLQTIDVEQTTLLDAANTISGHLTVIADKGGTKYAITPALTVYSGSLTQAGALTPGTLSPADGDAGDATIHVIAKPPAVVPTSVADTFSMAPNDGTFPTTITVNGLANGVLGNDTDANGPINATIPGATVGTATVGGVPTKTYTQATANGTVTLNA